MKTLITLGSILLLWCSLCQADVPVYFIHSRGQNALSRAQAKRLVSDVKDYYLRYKINIQVVGIKTVNNPFPRDYRSYNNGLSLYYQWNLWVQQRQFPDVRKLVISPPLSENGYWMFGFANICQENGVGIASAEMRNENNQNRYLHSVNAVAHELGHLMGATHDNKTQSTMTPGSLSLIKGNLLSMSSTSLKEINACLKQ